MKVYVIGHGECGKDTICEIMNELHGISFSTSSWHATPFVRGYIYADLGISYESDKDCHEDRRNHRQTWREAIESYCFDDKTRMSREIFEKSMIYSGIRSYEEFKASAHMSDLVIWIDRDVPEDPTLDIPREVADIIVDNNGSLEDLRDSAYRIGRILRSAEKTLDANRPVVDAEDFSV